MTRFQSVRLIREKAPPIHVVSGELSFYTDSSNIRKEWLGRKMNILLAEDQSRVRSALRLMLEQQTEEHVVEEVATLRDMMKLARNHCCDVVLLDWKLLGADPDKIIKSLKVSCPGLLIIAMDSNPQTRQVALEAGASKFVSKNDPPEGLLAAINSYRGGK